MSGPVRDATSAFLGAIGMNFRNFSFTVEEIRSRSWASATFTGARHELTFRIAGDGAREAADAFLANLSAAEFQLRGHIMADIALLWEERKDGEDGVRISLEALTVEEC
jgi:hypothetical protein